MPGRCFLIGLLFFLLFSVEGNSQTVLRNLIQNPSFEYTGKDTVRDNPDESWTFESDNESVTGHVTASRSIDGFRSFLIRAEDGRGYLESEPFDVQRYERYLLSFGACGDGSIQTIIRWWREIDDSLTLLEDEFVDIVVAGDDWNVPQFHVTAPRRATAASVRFAIFDGYVWIDDIRFR